MAILIAAPAIDPRNLVAVLQSLDDNLDVRIWPDDGEVADIQCVLSWNHPTGILKCYANLKLICSYGAGVDHIINDPDLAPDIPIVRCVDERLVAETAHYTLAVLLSHYRSLPLYREHQQRQEWRYLKTRKAHETVVGIMGLGKIGTRAAQLCSLSGFRTYGWSSNAKQIDGVRCFHGNEQLPEFLQPLNYLICLLPLTPETRGILNRDTFAQLPHGVYLVHAGRGEHLVEADLLTALDQGQLCGACLDVFQQEPLPTDHPFWEQPKITITPHIAGRSDQEAIAAQVFENYQRSQRGEPLLNLVDRKRGY